MRTLMLALLVSAALVGVARADQNDPRLGPLFAQLKASKDAHAGAQVARKIWDIWFDSDNPEVKDLIRTGQIHLHTNRIAQAAEFFNRVVAMAPKFAEGWNRRATVRYLQGDYAGSLRDIERTLKLEPRHFGALSGRGLVYSKLGRSREALAAFRAALAINPHLPAARLNIRLLRKKLGEKAI